MRGYELLESLNPVPETRGDPGSVPPAAKARRRTHGVYRLAFAVLMIGAGIAALTLWERDGVVDVLVTSPDREPSAPSAVAVQPAPSPAAESKPAAVAGGALAMLPDPERWVVVQDWTAMGTPAGGPGDLPDVDGVQLGIAPLDAEGVPQLHREIHLTFSQGSIEDFDRRWGDTPHLGAVDFTVDGGIGRSVQSTILGMSMAQVWTNGTFVEIQTQDADIDLAELAKSLTEVDQTTWIATRSRVAEQRLIAIEAAMEAATENTKAPAPSGAPLPHWVLPDPWQLQWVTDKTIWTPEQHAQNAGFREAMQPPSNATERLEHRLWHYGFAETAEAAAAQFVPAVTVSVAVYAETPNRYGYPINYEKITALGLDGVISKLGGEPTILVELGTGELQVHVSAQKLSNDEVRQFLAEVEFISADPLDGLAVPDPRYQLVSLLDLEGSPESWHAAWKHPETDAEARISVRRLTVPELRAWLQPTAGRFDVPDDVWETVAAGGVVDLGRGVTYNVSEGLLIDLGGIDHDDLVPIALDDWITLASPVNADPVNPR